MSLDDSSIAASVGRSTLGLQSHRQDAPAPLRNVGHAVRRRLSAIIILEMKDLSKESATFLEVGEDGAGQRIDNYLLKILKGVPKSHVYRILRSG